jgi:hypothetical protein
MGSAPVSNEVPPAQKTYFASSAAHQMAVIGNCWGEICCVFPIGVVETGSPEPELSLFLKHAPYDRLFLRKSLWSLTNSYNLENYIDLARDVTPLSYRYMLKLWAKHVGPMSLLLYWLRGAKLRDYIHLLNIPHSHKTSWLENFSSAVLSTSSTKLSSGVLSLLIAIDESEPDQKIHVFGITLTRQEYSYDLAPRQLDEAVKGHEGHMKADKLALIKVFKHHFARLDFDDEELRVFLLKKL